MLPSGLMISVDDLSKNPHTHSLSFYQIPAAVLVAGIISAGLCTIYNC